MSRLTGPCLALFLAQLLSSTPSPAQSEAPRLTYEFRPLRDESSDYRTLRRSSVLCGPTEFRVATAAPHRVAKITIVNEGRIELAGKQEVLCRSPDSSNRCEVDFGEIIARQTFRVETEVRDNGDTSRMISRSFRTLDTHPAGEASSLEQDILVEHVQVETFPPDEVTRLIRVARTEGKGENARTTYLDDLAQDDFRVEVENFGEVKVLSVHPSDPTHRKLVPILFNVADYLKQRRFGKPELDWRNDYEDIVFALVEGLRTAARRGVDVEYLLVPYAATGRVFGPFRLQPGTDLDESRLRAEDETLRALEEFLVAPPLPQWQEQAGGRWVDNWSGMIHTLNDLYLRGYDGLVQGVWVTGGWSTGSDVRSRFQEAMWPERLKEINPEWDDTELVEFVERVDGGRDVRSEKVSRFLGLLEEYSPHAAARITTFLRELGAGASGTLQAHRVDSSPMLNVLLVPSDRMLRADRMAEFTAFVSGTYGGEVSRLTRLDKNRSEPREERPGDPPRLGSIEAIARILERTYEQLVHSYVVNIEVPNPDQNGAAHDLSFKVVERGGDGKATRLSGYDVAYMPYYTSSRSFDRRLPDYLGSPFKELRILSAYELRNYWSDDELYAVRADRWRVEPDDQVRSVLFETWVSINLKRLQAQDLPHSQRKHSTMAEIAYDKLRLAGESAEGLPDPLLARDAAMLAEWYRADHEELFSRAKAAPN